MNVPAGVWITGNRHICNECNCSYKKQIPDSNLRESKNHCIWKRKELVSNHNTVSSFHLAVKCCCPLKCLHNHVELRAFVTDAVFVLAAFEMYQSLPLRLSGNSQFHLFFPLISEGKWAELLFPYNLSFFPFPFDLWFLSAAYQCHVK